MFRTLAICCNHEFREEPEKNLVDKLVKKIELIQTLCHHEFKPIYSEKIHFLEKSSVDSVYLGDDPDAGGSFGFDVRCVKCSLVLSSHIKKTCPRCGAAMRKGESTEPRKQYHWGSSRLNYVARVYSCSCCAFKTVLDEWSPE